MGLMKSYQGSILWILINSGLMSAIDYGDCPG